MCSSYVIAKNYVVVPLLNWSMMTVIGPSYLDQKDFILWTKFYSPGGLWQHKVGWILEKQTKIMAWLRRKGERLYLVVKAGNNRVFYPLICLVSFILQDLLNHLFLVSKCWEGLFTMPKIIGKKELLSL